jgi:hypothetical protein
LKMLADASTHGCAEAVLKGQGFDATMLAELVNAGLVSRMPEPTPPGLVARRLPGPRGSARASRMAVRALRPLRRRHPVRLTLCLHKNSSRK